MKTIEEISEEMKGIIGAYPIDDIFDEDRCINEILSIEVGGYVFIDDCFIQDYSSRVCEKGTKSCNCFHSSRPRTLRDLIEEKVR